MFPHPDDESFGPAKVISKQVREGHAALDCYVTYKDVIEETGERENTRRTVPFEFFREDFDPPVDDVFYAL